jgi:hypothetical protein
MRLGVKREHNSRFEPHNGLITLKAQVSRLKSQ